MVERGREAERPSRGASVQCIHGAFFFFLRSRPWVADGRCLTLALLPLFRLPRVYVASSVPASSSSSSLAVVGPRSLTEPPPPVLQFFLFLLLLLLLGWCVPLALHKARGEGRPRPVSSSSSSLPHSTLLSKTTGGRGREGPLLLLPPPPGRSKGGRPRSVGRSYRGCCSLPPHNPLLPFPTFLAIAVFPSLSSLGLVKALFLLLPPTIHIRSPPPSLPWANAE